MFFSLPAVSAVSQRPDRSGGFLGRWDLTSPTTFSPCGLAGPSPDALCVFRRELAGLGEATPSIHRLLRKARTVYGPPPPAPWPTSDSAPQHGFCLLQDGPLWEDPALAEAPPRHEPLPRHRDHPDAPQTLAAAPQALAQPATQRPLRLVTQPTPGSLGGPPAHVPVARLGAAVFPGALAAVLRRRGYARSAPYLTTLFAVTPAQKCHPQHPCSLDAETLQLPQLPSLLAAGFG
jgi:hypothetical protein